MAGTVIMSKKLLERLRAAFKRYGRDVLGDPDIGIDFFATDYEESVGVLLTSPKFEPMAYTERQNSVWDYLIEDPQMKQDDMFYIARISTGTEPVEFIS